MSREEPLFIAELAPTMYNLPELLDAFTSDEWTFDDEVCAEQFGACAIHMEWQEPFTIMYRLGRTATE